MRRFTLLILLLFLLITLNSCLILQKDKSKHSINSNQNQIVDAYEYNNENSTSEIIDIEQANGQRSTIYLGMKKDDITSMDLYNTDNEITEIKVLQENLDAWDYNHTAIWTPNMCLLFDNSERLYKVTVNGEIPTKLGLHNGDSIKILEKLYGKSDKKYDGGRVHEYNFNDYYFFVNVIENNVILWGISKFKYDYDGEK